MAELKWNEVGKREYETGVKKGVLFVRNGDTYGNGVAWEGLTKVSEKPTGAETTSLYANDAKYVNLLSAEEFEGTIEAYMSPKEFDDCDGTAEIAKGVRIGQQDRKTFGLSYVTTIGNDTDGNAHGYKIHLVYGCTASPSQKDYQTINNSPEAATLSWEFKTTPVDVANYKPTATLVIDSTEVDAQKLSKIEELLYGTASAESTLPLPSQIISIINGTSA